MPAVQPSPSKALLRTPPANARINRDRHFSFEFCVTTIGDFDELYALTGTHWIWPAPSI